MSNVPHIGTQEYKYIIVNGKKWSGKTVLCKKYVKIGLNVPYIAFVRTTNGFSEHCSAEAVYRYKYAEKEISRIIAERNVKSVNQTFTKNDDLCIVIEEIDRSFANSDIFKTLRDTHAQLHLHVIVCVNLLSVTLDSLFNGFDYLFVLRTTRRSCKYIYEKLNIKQTSDMELNDFVALVDSAVSQNDGDGRCLYNVYAINAKNGFRPSILGYRSSGFHEVLFLHTQENIL